MALNLGRRQVGTDEKIVPMLPFGAIRPNHKGKIDGK